MIRAPAMGESGFAALWAGEKAEKRRGCRIIMSDKVVGRTELLLLSASDSSPR